MVVPRNLNDSTAFTELFMIVSGGRAGGFLLKSTIISTVLSVLYSNYGHFRQLRLINIRPDLNQTQTCSAVRSHLFELINYIIYLN